MVWEERNELFNERNMNARLRFVGDGVTVWGGIMFHGKTELVVSLRESINREQYLALQQIL